MVPFSFSGSSSATGQSGDASQNSGYNGSGFNVNYGNGVSQGAGVPTWVWVVGIIGAVLILRKRRK